MRYIGIDIASETHWAAVVDEDGSVLVKAFPFREDADGYARLFAALPPPDSALVTFEATGHYWKNLVAALAGKGFQVALVNPLRTKRYAEEDLSRAKTDAVDATRIARFSAEKRLVATNLPSETMLELRELSRHRDRLIQELGDKTRMLHRLVDLGFPEFVRIVGKLETPLATGILEKYPTAAALKGVRLRELANHKYDGQKLVGLELAKSIIETAKRSVGAHHGPAYRLQVEQLCEDIARLRERISQSDKTISGTLKQDELAQLLLSIDGLGETTVAKILGEVGDPSKFDSPKALAAYVGAAPHVHQSGVGKPWAALGALGNASLRRALYSPTLSAIRFNPWLKAFYEGLIARGKPKKLAILASLRKLLHAIYSVAKNRKPFEPRLVAVTP
jgi:transposase